MTRLVHPPLEVRTSGAIFKWPDPTWPLPTDSSQGPVVAARRWPHESSTHSSQPLDDPDTEHERRFLTVRAGETVVATSYVPNGNSGPEPLPVKLTHLNALRDWTSDQLAGAGRLLLAGDFNVAAERIDVSRPTHRTGFLPSEREAFAALLDLGLADCFRVFHPGEPGHYTWWENWPGARERNVGWRFDYLLASPLLAEELQACRHAASSPASS
jgi:exodeoxyribonuclease III